MNSLLTKTIAEPVLAGASAALIDAVIEGTGAVPTPFGSLPTSLVAFASVAASSAVAEIVNNYALANYNFVQNLGRLAKPAFTGIANVGVATLLVGTDSNNMAQAFVIGAAGEVSGNFLWDKASKFLPSSNTGSLQPSAL